MITEMIFLAPILLLLPLFVMIMFCYPVRKKDDIIRIGYPIYCKKYTLLSNDFNLEVERFSSFRGGAWAVVIRVCQKDSKVIIRTHRLQGHHFLKGATKELNKVRGIIYR